MYSDLKTKCETMITDLTEIKPDLIDEKGAIKDVKAGNLLQMISAAARELNHVINTIDAYYSEQ